MTGSVVKKVDDRGFGFIKPDDSDKEMFFHARSVIGDIVFDDLREGDKVTFEVEEGPKGPAAVDVAKAAANTNAAPTGDDVAEAA